MLICIVLIIYNSIVTQKAKKIKQIKQLFTLNVNNVNKKYTQLQKSMFKMWITYPPRCGNKVYSTNNRHKIHNLVDNSIEWYKHSPVLIFSRFLNFQKLYFYMISTNYPQVMNKLWIICSYCGFYIFSGGKWSYPQSDIK